MAMRSSSSCRSVFAIAVVALALPLFVACGGAIDAPHGDGTESKGSTPPVGSAMPGPFVSPPASSGVVGPNRTCEAPKCNDGDVTELGIRLCPPGATCYQRSACGKTVYCTSYPQCDVQPVCPPGYDLVASCLSGGTPDCLQQTSCGITIQCEAHPDVDAGF